MGKGKHSAKAIEKSEKAVQALELRKAGATYDQIAEQLELATRMTAWRLIDGAITERMENSEAAKIRHMELERLDSLLLSMWQKAVAGDLKAVDRVLRIMERRARYLGLDAPTGAGVNVNVLNANWEEWK